MHGFFDARNPTTLAYLSGHRAWTHPSKLLHICNFSLIVGRDNHGPYRKSDLQARYRKCPLLTHKSNIEQRFFIFDSKSRLPNYINHNYIHVLCYCCAVFKSIYLCILSMVFISKQTKVHTLYEKSDETVKLRYFWVNN